MTAPPACAVRTVTPPRRALGAQAGDRRHARARLAVCRRSRDAGRPSGARAGAQRSPVDVSRRQRVRVVKRSCTTAPACPHPSRICAPASSSADPAMPIYGFQCTTCGHAFDRLQKMADPDPQTCPPARRPRSSARSPRRRSGCPVAAGTRPTSSRRARRRKPQREQQRRWRCCRPPPPRASPRPSPRPTLPEPGQRAAATGGAGQRLAVLKPHPPVPTRKRRAYLLPQRASKRARQPSLTHSVARRASYPSCGLPRNGCRTAGVSAPGGHSGHPSRRCAGGGRHWRR